MDVLRTRAARWIAAGLGLLLLALGKLAPAGADSNTLLLTNQPVVVILLAGHGNDVTVRTWDRPFVQIDDPDNATTITRTAAVWGTPRFPLTARLPPFRYVERQDGQIVGNGLMPPEDFPLSGFRAGAHDVVRIRALTAAHVTVMVPPETGYLDIRSNGGSTTIDGYHGADLFIRQSYGQIHVGDAATTAYFELQNGLVQLSDDDFSRVRVRANAARVVFERCRSTQIEATTVSGSIVYDGGSFEPGLARFESESGAIALGVNAGAQLVAHSQDGRVFTRFDQPAQVTQRGESDAAATIGGGGALVNAISQRGNVYLYDGALNDHRNLGPEWRPAHQAFRRPAAMAQPGFQRPPPMLQRPPLYQHLRRYAPARPALRARTFERVRRRA
ncbi:MAG TPA: DUF4097 family beta strand repeat-containing protein [Candidatus Sulfotelmatobacter sp.]|nr:DUF4097 family beta strand repeat-containing protein [Candidatus Sulfotelmatobacter sp.]